MLKNWKSNGLNTSWGRRKAFADGKVTVGYKTFLGYDKGENGKMVVNKEEAKTIKFIYQLFLKGLSLYAIKKELEKHKLKTPMGKTKWHVSTIRSQLQNEKYKGDAILQKAYTVDFLTKKQKKNNGELPKYYVSDDHEAIIDKKTFDFVQIELKKRLEVNKKGIYNRVASRYSGINIFSGKIVCGECGGFFGRKVWHSNDKYKRIVYRCNRKFDNDKKCETGVVTEDEIKQFFVEEYNKLDKTKAIKKAKDIIKKLTNTNELETSLKAEKEISAKIVEKINALIDKNSRVAMNQDEFKSKKEEFIKEFDEHKKKSDAIETEIKSRQDRKVLIESFINNIEESNKLKDFDEGLFCSLVDKVVVYKDRKEIRWRGSINFNNKNEQ